MTPTIKATDDLLVEVDQLIALVKQGTYVYPTSATSLREQLWNLNRLCRSNGEKGTRFLSSLLADALQFSNLNEVTTLDPLRDGIQLLAKNVTKDDFFDIRERLILGGYEIVCQKTASIIRAMAVMIDENCDD